MSTIRVGNIGPLTGNTAPIATTIGGPAFNAYQSVAQSLSSSTWTKLQFNVKEFDTDNCYDASTNYRFTPNLAGYYTFSFAVAVGSSITNVGIALYKNGSQYRWPYYINGSAGNVSCANSGIVYANGTTDYFEIYAYFSTGQNTYASSSTTFFSGYMVRSAA